MHRALLRPLRLQHLRVHGIPEGLLSPALLQTLAGETTVAGIHDVQSARSGQDEQVQETSLHSRWSLCEATGAVFQTLKCIVNLS